MANILVGAALLAVIGIAARSVWKSAKSGGCSACGGSCHCAASGKKGAEESGACPHCASRQ